LPYITGNNKLHVGKQRHFTHFPISTRRQIKKFLNYQKISSESTTLPFYLLGRENDQSLNLFAFLALVFRTPEN
jgi:hypothetical protein